MNRIPRQFVSALVAVVTLVFIGSVGQAHAAPTPTSGPTSGGTAISIPGIKFVEVDAGNNTMVALTDQGTVYTWGRNDYGQLGDGTTTASFTPVQVKGVNGVGYLTGVTHISAGQQHILASTADGVYAWGRNGDGQLGDGTNTNRSTPVQVLGVGSSGLFPAPTAISAGEFHSLALTADGLFAWGSNGYGELGDNTQTQRRSPVQVKGVGGTGFLTGVTAIAAGLQSSVALGATDVYTWGKNSAGQLGIGSTDGMYHPLPNKVKDSAGTGFLAGATAIAAGQAFAMALLPSGVFTWGDNTYSQLGDGTASATATLPVQVVGVGGSGVLSGVTAIGAGYFNGWAQTSSGVFGWGSNSFGKLGTGNTVGPANSPVRTLGLGGAGFLTGVTSLNGGWSASSAILNGQVVAWGHNGSGYGQLGDGTTTDRLSPVLSANFQPGTVTVDSLAPIPPTVAGNAWSIVIPAHAAGAVTITGTAYVFGGTTAANPSTVSWNAGTFTYAEEPTLAATGINVPIGLQLGGLAALLSGMVLVYFRRKVRS